MVATLADLASIEAGATAHLSKTITREDILAFAHLTGDHNPLHVDAEFARSTNFQKPVAHGMLLASFVSTMVGMQLPGPGALWMRQSFRWPVPVFAGDSIDITLRVTHKSTGSNTLTVEVNAVNQDGKTVMSGEGAVMLLEKTPQQKEEKQLAERVAFVSGASRGIGAAIATRLAKEGAAVLVNYNRDEKAAESVVSSIRDMGGRAISVQADVAAADGIARAVEQGRKEFGRVVDVLVNNASVAFVPKAFTDTAWDEIQEFIDVQLRGAFQCCRAVLPGMLEQKSGCIVNIGSALTGSIVPPNWTLFVMVKSALLGLTRSLATELGPQGIRVNMVSPGTTATDSIGGLAERLRKVQAMQTPLRRLASGDDVAKAVVFLCSGASSFMTGADLPISGGSSL
jgi:3-oxoacyl-[acyl-carrier protein] reductase